MPSYQGQATYGALVLAVVLAVIRPAILRVPAMPEPVTAKTKLPDTTKVPTSKTELVPVVLLYTHTTSSM